MFGSIGQPVSGVKDERTARAFMGMLQDDADRQEHARRRGRLRRQRVIRAVKGWFSTD